MNDMLNYEGVVNLSIQPNESYSVDASSLLNLSPWQDWGSTLVWNGGRYQYSTGEITSQEISSKAEVDKGANKRYKIKHR